MDGRVGALLVRMQTYVHFVQSLVELHVDRESVLWFTSADERKISNVWSLSYKQYQQ